VEAINEIALGSYPISGGEKITQQINDKLLRSLNTFENEGNPTKIDAFARFLIFSPLDRL
jgi:hypothetical protein